MTAIISRIIKMSYKGILMKTTNYPQMKLSWFLMLLVFLTGLTSPASAEIDLTGLYSGLQYSSTEFKADDSGSTESASNGHIKTKLGKFINENLSVEGQLGLTTNSNDKQGALTYGVYLRAGKDFGQYKPYGLIGLSGYYSYVGDFSQSEAGGSLGAGVEIFGSKEISVTFEFLRLIDKTIDGTDVTFDTFGLGFTYYFTEESSYFNKNRNKIRSIRH